MLHVAFPVPYAVVHLNGVEVASTVVDQSLNPIWNDTFKLWVYSLTMEAKAFTYTFCSSVTKQSLITVKIFDEKKRKKADRKDNVSGLFGGINFLVGEVIDIDDTSL
jgi:Ca2+-dependent lipid-binding protein